MITFFVASGRDKEAAQAPYKSRFVCLGCSVWLTLESSMPATPEREEDLEEALTAVQRQVNCMGTNW